MVGSDIVVKGAREHNLRDVNLHLPAGKLIVFTGVSGSGKSSLAFDTLYAEGQRRYVESLSTYARQFLGQLPKPEVDHISGLSPSISIQQKTAGRNPRSTVGTITEIYDYLRVLYARVGQGHCPECGRVITAQTREQIIERILSLEEGTPLLLLAPLVREQKGEYRDLFEDLLRRGFLRARVNGKVVQLTSIPKLGRQMRHTIEAVVDRLKAGATIRSRLAEAVEQALELGAGNLIVAIEADGEEGGRRRLADGQTQGRGDEPGQGGERSPSRDLLLSAHYACTHCGTSYEPPSPQLFSFNSPQGMCLDCHGLGERYDLDPELLIDQRRTFAEGAVALAFGPGGQSVLQDLGRWKRHLYEGVAEAIERDLKLPPGSVFHTPWKRLDRRARHALLYGTGERHITFSWRHGGGVWKHGGTFDGIIPDLMSKYGQSAIYRRVLEPYLRIVRCGSCDGQRLNPQARAVTVTGRVGARAPKVDAAPRRIQFGEADDRQRDSCASARGDARTASPLTLPQLCGLTVAQAAEFFVDVQLDAIGWQIAGEAVKEIRERLRFLLNVGLDYLTLDRAAPSLSGGEAQRIRLAGQIGAGLVGVLYVLDEPSIGLHPRDNARLLATLRRLRDMGNTVLVVEHDEETMRTADHIVDFGPGPGVQGGEVVVEGPLDAVLREPRSVTGRYLAGELQIAVPPRRRPAADKRLRIVAAEHNNLKRIDVEFPLGLFICVTGVSGSGKSSLVNDILWEALNRDLNKGHGEPGAHLLIDGLEHLDKAINIDQSPIGRTPRSNPATYVKVFDEIRRLYAQLPEARARGYKPGRFSFNVAGGRCEACEGNGSNRLEMDFLADIWVTCPVCGGHRFNRETLQVRFKEKNIFEVLDMDVREALAHFENVPKIAGMLQTLERVGLGYLKLGQPSPTLSGGEAQRIKLARELVKRSTGRTLYLLDEPTTGLHFADIQKLLDVLHGFADGGNTVVVIEHNLDVVKTADWIIDLGPEGGEDGGRVVVAGTPEKVSACAESYTGRALERHLRAGHAGAAGFGLQASGPGAASEAGSRKPDARTIAIRGASQHNLQAIDLELPRNRMTVFCGPSGSGKSSLAMDTLYAEGQRRYVESLSAYARQFVGQMQKPKVESISGLSPAIAIEQKTASHTPRSTVGTVTEIYDYLRILYARLGQPHCPDCDAPVGTQTCDEIIDRVLAAPEGAKLYLLAPLDTRPGDNLAALWRQLRNQGFVRVRIDGRTYTIDDAPAVDRRQRHEVEVVVDRVTVRHGNRSRLGDSIEAALELGRGNLRVAHVDPDRPEPEWRVDRYSQHFACDGCGRSFQQLSPHNFSFNSPLGWCPACQGLGTQHGTNPAALIRDPRLTLREGAIAAWPELAVRGQGSGVGQGKAGGSATPGRREAGSRRGAAGRRGAVLRDLSLSHAVFEALAGHGGFSLDTPFDKLTPRQQRMILHGTGERWIEVHRRDAGATGGVAVGRQPPAASRRIATPSSQTQSDARSPVPEPCFVGLKVQYKGLYPAIDEATRLSPFLRAQLDHLVDEVACAVCGGSRLRDDAAAVRFRGKTLPEVCELPLGECRRFFAGLKLSAADRRVAGELLREIRHRLKFLVDVGLDYLTLARAMPTLSGGEAQRIRLASQVGSGLTGVLYVLDEPTIGLHPRDNHRLLKALAHLRDLGNTLVVVEHDRDCVAAADRLVDFGPGAGRLGGRVVAEGTPQQVGQNGASLTGDYLSGRRAIPVPRTRRIISVEAASRRVQTARSPRGHARPSSAPSGSGERVGDAASTLPPGGAWLEVLGARQNNLKDIDVAFPLGAFICVTGVSGSGKSSLVDDVLYNALARRLHRARTIPGAHRGIRGIEHINKVIRVDQQPLGNTPTSNPATYTGAFDLIRELFAHLPDSRVRGYTARRFSFNKPGGRCEACEGNGRRLIEMHFLPDVWVECETCRGKRYNPETLAVRYKGKSIADVLEMSAAEALQLFRNIPKVRAYLQTLCDVGLDYLALGQAAPTLSGGEAQRVKLAAELARPQTGRTLYLLDEPTTGLHFDDLRKLLGVLHRLVDLGNTVIVIEHNLDVIKTADWIVDLGPEAGDAGGRVVACGTPEEVAGFGVRGQGSGIRADAATGRRGDTAKVSCTGRLLAEVLARGPFEERPHRGRRRAVRRDPLQRVELTSRNNRDRLKAVPTNCLLSSDLSSDGESQVAAFEEGGLDIADVGRGVPMPWEADGRRWHTRDRLTRHGRPCRWEGEALEYVIDRIHELGKFGETNWNDRTVVEIAASRKSDGWFFHASTGDQWLLRLRFRVAKGTFRQEALRRQLALKPLDDLPELPIYGQEDRVHVTTRFNLWQEVAMAVASLKEIETPGFEQFLKQAVESFTRQVKKARVRPAAVMPWTVLGRNWHLSPKGFPPGKPRQWDPAVLEHLLDVLTREDDDGRRRSVDWQARDRVHLRVNGRTWATILTKRSVSLELCLFGPRGKFNLAMIEQLGSWRAVQSGVRRDIVRIEFRSLAEVKEASLAAFLRRHLASLAQ